ncbi:hypothetical protein ANOM_011379 [Aspergillus nomiae NRRL 13137]|uniref:Citrate exporter 1 n=1 Tax=Aspergillus nomiae NRRL (strain ATCC 15546 / NRRL 13137 / CBS 260.88 / M93) TaxID=1509407 RepID=A0A0L1IKW2_ASPN3|nr:uncharacterized protein ANOM_011379 [Aspergillus nomiae NRRL 13137]KNG80236.1 hypothetical protein ANOM_011379 [Aspergillus nomiae NRRL 13137]
MNSAEPKTITPTTEDVREDGAGGVPNEPPQPLFSILSEKEKIFTICTCSMVTFLAPVAASMYFPALGPLARDMHVSSSKISLTITSFKIVEGVAPLLTASFSDQNGRRPVLLASVLIFIGSNVGLALQSSYAGLVTLRCFQALGSSNISLISNAAVADVVPRAERGRYMFYSSLGMNLGPALGPTLGGILTQFLGWRSIFWFLSIFSGVMLCVVMLFLRETCRAIVGNGSVSPQPWNRCALQFLRLDKQHAPDYETRVTTRRRPGILATLGILLDSHISLLLLCNALCFCGTQAILSSLPVLLERKYQLRPLHIGLCYLPFTAGSILTRWNVGTLVDRNYKRHAHKAGEELRPNQQTPQQLRRMPLEKVRLELALPSLYLSGVCLIGYGWIMYYDVHLAGPLVLLFLFGNATTGVNNSLVTLAIDLNAYRPAATMAAMNTVKSLAAAGAVAAAVPLIDAIGIGWVGTFIAGLWFLASPTLWILYWKGQRWRQRESSEQD